MKTCIMTVLVLFVAATLQATTDSTTVTTTEPTATAAQSLPQIVRIGYIARDSVLKLMPETERIGRELTSLEQEYKEEYDVMVRNYNKKVKAYIEKDRNLNETIRLAHQAEITEMEKRIQKYRESYLKALDQYRAEAYGPLNERLDNAIRQAAEEQEITILFDASTPLYTSADCIDLTPYVISALGLKP